MDSLTNLLHLEVNFFRVKGDRICYIGDGLMGIVEYSIEH